MRLPIMVNRLRKCRRRLRPADVHGADLRHSVGTYRCNLVIQALHGPGEYERQFRESALARKHNDPDFDGLGNQPGYQQLVRPLD